jgi:aryl-alcohol dehydrogenase-like predicted oxidoreductase
MQGSEATMEYRTLGGSGLKVPVLTLGTATFGGGSEFLRKWGASDVREAQALVSICLEAGCNLFDTADGYSAGLSEEILGQAIKGRREQVLIAVPRSVSETPDLTLCGERRR